MAVSLKEAVRQVQWNANKRTTKPTPRVGEQVFERAWEARERGAYEEGIEIIEGAPAWKADPRAWRTVGLCRLGLKQHLDARKAFEEAIRLNTLESAKDEVNKAAVQLDEGAFDEAEQTAKRARQLAPKDAIAVVCLLSIYNRTRRQKDIELLISELSMAQPEILSDPHFLERLANDTDLIGVSAIVRSLAQH
jgi:tetratricopeptide (TPR) repeat protein